MLKTHTYRFHSELIRTLRELKGLSHESFAKPIGKSGPSIMNWEAGKTFPDCRDLANIASAFNVDPASFFMKDAVKG